MEQEETKEIGKRAEADSRDEDSRAMYEKAFKEVGIDLIRI